MVRGWRQGHWGAGGAGLGTLGWSGVGDEDSGGWGTRAEGLKVRGPPSLLFSLLSQPSPLQLPAASGGGGNLRQGRGAGNRGWLGLGGSVPGRSPAHMAPPRLPARPRLCVGQQVPGLPRPCVQVPRPSCLLPRDTGRAILSGVWGWDLGGASAAAPQPPGDVEPALIRWFRGGFRKKPGP